ncbi:L-idonate 5-dehydrogenase [Tersicoccus phoenicis]|uniref:L-idonate 5-dehydrogenase n=2 Tax=Tersicoccus phoenicis TaxID=554083 RepID=A0A1R1LHI5_9MICC|nr:L-idonate 5-dehydrogenase [Tersicoccus phoenicis]
MRVLELQSAGDLRVVERPTPRVGAGDVLIRVGWGGICGSDIAYWRSGRSGSAVQRHPFVLGHEIAGTVVTVGAEVDALSPGDAVTVHPAATAGALPERLAGRDNLHPNLTYLGSAAHDPHTDGGFAEQIAAPASRVRRLPAALPIRRAALAEPLGVALHAVTRAGDVTGQDVLVSGAGPIGALTVVALRAAGAGRVTVIDPAPAARDRATALGADRVLDVGEAITGSPTVAFEASGAATSVASVLGLVATGGVVVQVGNLPLDPVTVPLALLVSRELDYRGTYRFVNEIDRAVEVLAATPAAETVITHEFALDETDEAFATAADGQRSCKVLLRF